MINAPQIEPITTLSRNHKEMLRRVKGGPVYLTQHGKSAAVLLSPEYWAAVGDELSRLRRIVEGDKGFAAIRAGDFVDYDNIDQELAHRAASS